MVGPELVCQEVGDIGLEHLQHEVLLMLLKNLHELQVVGIKLLPQVIGLVVIKLEILSIVEDFVEHVLDIFLGDWLRPLANNLVSVLGQPLSQSLSAELVGFNQHFELVKVVIIHLASLLRQHLLLVVVEMLVQEILESFLRLVDQVWQQSCLVFALVSSILAFAGLQEIQVLLENSQHLLVLVVNQV